MADLRTAVYVYAPAHVHAPAHVDAVAHSNLPPYRAVSRAGGHPNPFPYYDALPYTASLPDTNTVAYAAIMVIELEALKRVGITDLLALR